MTLEISQEVINIREDALRERALKERVLEERALRERALGELVLREPAYHSSNVEIVLNRCLNIPNLQFSSYRL